MSAQTTGQKRAGIIRLDNPRVWRTYLGGKMLDALHGIQDGVDGHFPEEWIMSVVNARNVGREEFADEGLSHVAGGPSLRGLLQSSPTEYLGEKHARENGASLGVLVKLIDSSERLTIQAHPDRPTAMRLFGSPHGKTECWHILGGRELGGEKPCIYLGFRKGVTREHWQELFARQDLEGMLGALERFDVKEGETILIEGGMPHAIGAGCFLAEIQEPTDFTIRVERTTPSGFAVDDFLCHQGLGFERMFDVFHYRDTSRDEIREKYFIKPSGARREQGGGVVTLIGYGDTPMFRLDEIRVSGELTIPGLGAFSGLYVLEGAGEAVSGGGAVPLETAAQFFVPAGAGDITFRAKPHSPLRILHFRGPKE